MSKIWLYFLSEVLGRALVSASRAQESFLHNWLALVTLGKHSTNDSIFVILEEGAQSGYVVQADPELMILLL
jgi:hypothetical protein